MLAAAASAGRHEGRVSPAPRSTAPRCGPFDAACRRCIPLPHRGRTHSATQPHARKLSARPRLPPHTILSLFVAAHYTPRSRAPHWVRQLLQTGGDTATCACSHPVGSIPRSRKAPAARLLAVCSAAWTPVRAVAAPGSDPSRSTQPSQSSAATPRLALPPLSPLAGSSAPCVAAHGSRPRCYPLEQRGVQPLCALCPPAMHQPPAPPPYLRQSDAPAVPPPLAAQAPTSLLPAG